MSQPPNDYRPPPPPPGNVPPGQPPAGSGPWAPPPQGPPPGSPPQQPPPPPSGYPPPDQPPRDRGGLVAGLVVVAIGLFLLLTQFVPDIGRWITLLIGLLFLAIFIARREYGWLVAGCIVSGVGVGVVLASTLDDPWSGAAMLFSIAGGFLVLWVVSSLLRLGERDWPRGPGPDAAKGMWWPLIPASILSLIALIVLAEDGVGEDVLRWWPVLIIGAGLLILLTSMSRRGRDGGR